MANPNLAAATNVYARNNQLSLTTTSATQLLSNAASSGLVLLVDSVVVANTDTVNAVTVTVTRFNSATNTGTAYAIASSVPVQAGQSLVVIDKYYGTNVTENESIYVTAGTANKLTVDANWKELS